MKPLSRWDKNLLELCALLASWTDGENGVVAGNSTTGEVYFLRNGRDAIKDMLIENNNLNKLTVYCYLYPSDQEIIDIESFGPEKILAFSPRECSEEFEKIDKEHIKNQPDPEDIRVYRMGAFWNNEEHCEIIACNANDDMQHAPGFACWCSDDYMIRIGKTPDYIRLMRYKEGVMKGFTLKYRVALLSTESGSPKLSLITSAKEYESALNSRNLIEFITPNWVEHKI